MRCDRSGMNIFILFEWVVEMCPCVCLCVCVSVCVSCSLVRFSGGIWHVPFANISAVLHWLGLILITNGEDVYCRRDTHRHHYVMDMCACVPVCNYLYCTYEPNNMDIPFLELPLFLHLSLASVFIGISNVQ